MGKISDSYESYLTIWSFVLAQRNRAWERTDDQKHLYLQQWPGITDEELMTGNVWGRLAGFSVAKKINPNSSQ